MVSWIIRLSTTEPSCDELSSILWDLNTTGVATSVSGGQVTLLAGFDTQDAGQTALEALSGSALVSPLMPPSMEKIDPEAWYQPEDRSQVEIPTEPPVMLDLQVGSAFGHGHHPTTKIAIELMARWARHGQRVIDFGTGTGVLGLAALALGANIVACIEIDPDSIKIAQQNLEFNRPVVGPQPMTFHSRIDQDLREQPRFDMVIANVLVGVHRASAKDLVDLVLSPTESTPTSKPTLIVSGILVDQLKQTEQAYYPFKIVESIQVDDWVGAALR